MTTRNAIRFAAIAACSVLLPAYAHHSYAMFDQCKPTALEGEINNVEWVNPHIVIYMRTPDVANYRVEWYSLGQLQREGIAAETLQAGDRVIITGHAMRDPSVKVLSLLSQIRRPSDDWTWNQPATRAGELHDELRAAAELGARAPCDASRRLWHRSCTSPRTPSRSRPMPFRLDASVLAH